MRKTLIVLSMLALAGAARAQTEAYSPDKEVAKSSGTVRVVSVSSQTFTLIETSTNVPSAYSSFVLLPGSDYAILQSTHAGGSFCCSFEADASTSITPGAKGCLQAKKESGGGFYEFEVRRWWQNLRLYCISMRTDTAAILRIGQTK